MHDKQLYVYAPGRGEGDKAPKLKTPAVPQGGRGMIAFTTIGQPLHTQAQGPSRSTRRERVDDQMSDTLGGGYIDR